MKPLLDIILLVILTILPYCHAYPCSGTSCRPRPSCNSQPCDSSYDCTESCDSSDSCKGRSCQNSYSCRSLRTCDARCCESSRCCESRCCSCPCPEGNTTAPRPPPSQSTSPPRMPTLPPRQPTLPPFPNFNITCPSSSSLCNNTNVNNNNNTVIIPTNITIQNEIHSETRITVPVNITVNNVNNIQILPSFSGGNATNGGSNQTGPVFNNTIYNITTEIINNTVRVPYPIQVPIPISYVITIPRPQPIPTGCCQTVQPCTPYHYCGCQQASFQCSHECFHPYTYQPINVCNNGCFRRNMAVGQQCSFGGCYHRFVDCSSCTTDFYQSYDGFLKCAGCFVPTPWGQIGPETPVASNMG